VCVDPGLGHEVQEGVHRDGADEGDAVDVGELGLAGLRLGLVSDGRGRER
jgi:hypothetical protein